MAVDTLARYMLDARLVLPDERVIAFGTPIDGPTPAELDRWLCRQAITNRLYVDRIVADIDRTEMRVMVRYSDDGPWLPLET